MRQTPHRPNRGRWEDIPPGRLLTLTEAAHIIGISRQALKNNYGGSVPKRKLPEGYSIVALSPRVLVLVREKRRRNSTTRHDTTPDARTVSDTIEEV